MYDYLKDKVVVITGASRGLGRELAVEFAKSGARVIATGRSKEGLLSLIGEIEKFDQKAVVVAYNVDVTKKKDVDDLAEKVMQLPYKSIDIWVNNAGVFCRGPIENATEEEIKRTFETNVYGMIYGVQSAVKYMKPKKSGHIINILSTSGLIGRSEQAIYVSSKWAMRGVHESLKQELDPFGIRVTAIFPGGMKTNLFDGYDVKTGEFMDPNEVAKAIVYTASLKSPISPTEIVLQRQGQPKK